MDQPGVILWLAALVFFLILEGATDLSAEEDGQD